MHRLALLSAIASAAAPVVAGAVVVPLAAVAGGPASPAPAWIKITPRGRTETRDGRAFAFDPEALAARFARDATAIPIDFEHATLHLATKGQRADAVGWIEAVEARQDGLYGRVEWLDAGKAALAARTHRYVSPTFPPDEAGNAVYLHSVALVTAPALANMPALAAADPKPPTETMMTAKIATALGLQAEASEVAILAALGGMVPKATHDATLATLSAAKTELEALQAAGRKAKIDAVLDEALKEKRIVPAQRESYAALCASDAGLAHVTALLAATPKGLGASGLDGRTPETGAAPPLDPVALAAKATAYQASQAAAGVTISYLDAFGHVTKAEKVS